MILAINQAGSDASVKVLLTRLGFLCNLPYLFLVTGFVGWSTGTLIHAFLSPKTLGGLIAKLASHLAIIPPLFFFFFPWMVQGLAMSKAQEESTPPLVLKPDAIKGMVEKFFGVIDRLEDPEARVAEFAHRRQRRADRAHGLPEELGEDAFEPNFDRMDEFMSYLRGAPNEHGYYQHLSTDSGLVAVRPRTPAGINARWIGSAPTLRTKPCIPTPGIHTNEFTLVS